MNGARAVLKSVLQDFPKADIDVSIIWIDMLPNDSAAAAAKSTRHSQALAGVNRRGWYRSGIFVGNRPRWVSPAQSRRAVFLFFFFIVYDCPGWRADVLSGRRAP